MTDGSRSDGLPVAAAEDPILQEPAQYEFITRIDRKPFIVKGVRRDDAISEYLLALTDSDLWFELSRACIRLLVALLRGLDGDFLRGRCCILCRMGKSKLQRKAKLGRSGVFKAIALLQSKRLIDEIDVNGRKAFLLMAVDPRSAFEDSQSAFPDSAFPDAIRDRARFSAPFESASADDATGREINSNSVVDDESGERKSRGDGQGERDEIFRLLRPWGFVDGTIRGFFSDRQFGLGRVKAALAVTAQKRAAGVVRNPRSYLAKLLRDGVDEQPAKDPELFGPAGRRGGPIAILSPSMNLPASVAGAGAAPPPLEGESLQATDAQGRIIALLFAEGRLYRLALEAIQRHPDQATRIAWSRDDPTYPRSPSLIAEICRLAAQRPSAATVESQDEKVRSESDPQTGPHA